VATDRDLSDMSEAIDDDTHVQISVVHGSVANAEYPLMIGGFEGEQFGGTERFLDRQFGGLLTSWSEIDLFPRQLGTARFVEPSRTADKETEPPGGYVIGLGSMAELGREELTYGVRQALVDRCMRLYRDPPVGCGPTDRIEVGVSSLLIGVREENGIRIEDSVAGIVEGVLQANLALARYEAAIAEPGPTVRVTALEFVERYAERANLAVVSLRRLPTAVQLSEDYVDLRAITVESRPGGLPLGAVLTETAPAWRRFLITSVEKDELASDRTLRLDVAVLGREARADRVQHRLDRAMVDSLVARVALNKDDVRTAATLYDQLIPHELRSAFQTTAGVQFIVDSTTANYPWELLGAPRPSGRRQAGGSFGGAMRQFTESEDRRLNPERASFGNALVIAAANVPGENELPGVLEEADVVSQLLESALPGKQTLLDDRRREIDLVRVQNELFGDHQVLHIASHGVYTEGRPDETGAILSSDCLLTVDTVRQLRFVPDVVFLNCCSLGRTGMNRLAAGLAREFMAIGVRALVAAAWPIEDAAASAFAETFYTELIAGRTLGDTVTRARNRAADLGGRETWAAYQCYGDPGFVLRGARATLSAAVTEPVSQSDLVARLDGLAVQTSDLGRPGRGGVQERRRRMLAMWQELAGWIDGRRAVAADTTIQRKLAAVARDLGEYRVAADRYRRFVVDDSAGKPVVGATSRATSIGDLQQTANCLARAAQKAARDSGAASDTPLSEALRGDLDLAIELAQTAVSLLPDRESIGVLASAYKRAATVDPQRRTEFATEAMASYRKADEQSKLATFGAENALQLGLIVGGEGAEWARRVVEQRSVPHPPAVDQDKTARRVDQRRADAVDFWTKCDTGDRALTRLIAADDDERREKATDDLIGAYQRAFASRSTWAERQSPIDHLRDLACLLAPDDPRRAFLQRACDALVQWEDVHVEEIVDDEADSSP
jgi:hypothetical protein